MPVAKWEVSSDAVGVFGPLHGLKDIYGSAMEKPNFAGIELIGWLWLNSLIRQSEESQIPVEGVHGRTGGVHDSYHLHDRIQLGALNELIVSTPTLVSKYAPRFPYTLIHGPELRHLPHLEAIRNSNNGSEHSLFIENHIRPGSFGDATEKAKRLYRDGIQSGVMIDLYHYIETFPNCVTLSERWDHLVIDIAETLDFIATNYPNLAVGFHVSIGTKRNDSLPLKDLNRGHWLAFKSSIDGEDVRVVFENQLEGKGSVYATKKARLEEHDRVMPIIDMFDNIGII